jgi:hypothetical protein
VKRIIFSLCAFFLFSGHLDATAEPARVEGRGRCSVVDQLGVPINQPLKDGAPNAGKEECDFTISLTGRIDPSTVDEVKEVLDRRRVWIEDKQESGLKLGPADLFLIDSPGGNLAAAMAIGRMIRKERITLFVAKPYQCVSACVIVLAGAAHRIRAGKIGIHRPFFDPPIGSQPLTSDKVRSNYKKMLEELRSYLREMNVSDRLADDMLAIDPADVRYLSITQLNDYGLRYVDPIEQETIDLQEAQSLGVDRGELMRRRALQKTNCVARHPEILKTLEALQACNERVMRVGQ